MNEFDLLSEPIRRFIRAQRWESLRPIQRAAIERILTTDENLILAARTASGKTEAAFLPILTAVNASAPGVQVLYISPLIALINDQFFRIEELIKFLEINVTKWHSEASRALKDSLLRNPSGILFITPESIEALFVNRPSQMDRLFGNVKFVIVDELHSFLGTKRGVQLQSLLSRLRSYCQTSRYLGLSATIGNYESAREFFGQPEKTKILRDSTRQPIEWKLEYITGGSPELPESLIDDLFLLTKNKRCLIFPNSRGRVEEIAVKLKKRVEREKVATRVFAHHSSVDREIREYAEHFAKTDTRTPFTIVCTSTLELGIDIGSIDLIVQVDSTGSVSSLSQRLGRSGRHEGDSNHLALFVTDEWHLLQSLACMSLLAEGILEPSIRLSRNYDIFLHQALAILKQTSGIPRSELIEHLQQNTAFIDISENECEAIIENMIADDYVELVERELIVGLKAETLVNSKEFYSVFDREDNLKVLNKDRVIGELQPSPNLKIDEKVFLAAQMWRIVEIDFKKKRIYVLAAPDAKKPAFIGAGMAVAPVVRQRMLDLLYSEELLPQLSEEASSQLKDMRRRFQSFGINDLQAERPVTIKPSSIILYSFIGTKINRTIQYAIAKGLGKKCVLNEHQSSFEIEGIVDANNILQEVKPVLESFPAILKSELELNEKQFVFSKWAEYLSIDFKYKLLLSEHFDVDAAITFCQNTKIICDGIFN